MVCMLGGLRLSRGGPRFNPRCARDRPVEIYFSPFNIGDCVSHVVRMTTENGGAVSLTWSGT